MTMNDVEEDIDRLLFAIPKKGRMFERVNELLLGAGLHYRRPNRVDIAHLKQLPVTLVFLPAKDIAAYVAEGKVDLGITGQDMVAEDGAVVNELELMGFGKCRLCLQAPIADKITSAASLAGKRIVTSFPNLATKYFKAFEQESMKTKIKYVSGSVEAACGLVRAMSAIIS